EPASERGTAGVDELQEQTVNLLNFQQVQNTVFHGQIAFNVLPETETSVRTELRIGEQLKGILGRTFPQPLLMASQAPVFHSHAFSMFIELLESPQDLALHLEHNPAFSLSGFAAGPSPVAVVGSDKIHIGSPRCYVPGGVQYALWIAADNLRIAASNAIQ